MQATSESKLFKFKQFDVDQTGCAMKINTDGVLLGALADVDNPANILDIGTGTGVIALMLSQRFPKSHIDAVEIDVLAVATAAKNFSNSAFADQIQVHPMSFERYFELNPGKKYDLIISNPPFYINSLKSPEKSRRVAKHADTDFFEKLIMSVSENLANGGKLCMILPVDTADFVNALVGAHSLFQQSAIAISSFPEQPPHRLIVYWSRESATLDRRKFVVYRSPGNYSEEYINLLKPYFIAF